MLEQLVSGFNALDIATRVLLVVAIILAILVISIAVFGKDVRTLATEAREENTPRRWGLYATGGGNFQTEPCTRSQALEQASKHGSVIHVDDTNHCIFYRPRVL